MTLYSDLQIFGTPAAARSSHSRQATRLVVIAGEEQRVQRERGVAQPAIAVVPVAHAAGCSGSEVVAAATMPPVGA